MDLPLNRLEALQSKLNQILESIMSLMMTLEHGQQMAMPTWPEILVKYNALLSQTHTMSATLSGELLGQVTQKNRLGQPKQPVNPFQRIAVHPVVPVTPLEGNIIGTLLRVIPSEDVLLAEENTVGRFSDIRTKLERTMGTGPEFDVQMEREMEKIREEHDSRISSALTAVTMLRDKYDWRTRLNFAPPPKPTVEPPPVAPAPEEPAPTEPTLAPAVAQPELAESAPIDIDIEDSDDDDMDDVLGEAES